MKIETLKHMKTSASSNSRRANVNAKDDDSVSPLHVAAAHGKIAIFSITAV